MYNGFLTCPVVMVAPAAAVVLSVLEVEELCKSHGDVAHTVPVVTGAQAKWVETVFTALNMRTLDVPVERAGAGGALAGLDNDLLLLTHQGRFFEVSGHMVGGRFRVDANSTLFLHSVTMLRMVLCVGAAVSGPRADVRQGDCD